MFQNSNSIPTFYYSRYPKYKYNLQKNINHIERYPNHYREQGMGNDNGKILKKHKKYILMI
jgi:hypothetical protein